MKISLRKANALQTAIQEHIKTIDIDMSLTINEFQPVTDSIVKARETLLTNDQRLSDLTAALYAIRGGIGDSNASAGISRLLAKAAYMDKRIAQVKGLTESQPTEDLNIVQSMLDKIKRDTDAGRAYGRDSVTVGILDQTQIDQYKVALQTLKREKQKINDQILELNIRTELLLEDDVADILRKEGLI